MWTFVMFDLPVKTKEQRKRYTKFRKQLLEMGFMQLQFSIYARFAESDERAAVFERGVCAGLPEQGEVRMLTVTGKQFSSMRVFVGEKGRHPEKESRQLELF